MKGVLVTLHAFIGNHFIKNRHVNEGQNQIAIEVKPLKKFQFN